LADGGATQILGEARLAATPEVRRAGTAQAEAPGPIGDAGAWETAREGTASSAQAKSLRYHKLKSSAAIATGLKSCRQGWFESPASEEAGWNGWGGGAGERAGRNA
jgi:hypothetical protein